MYPIRVMKIWNEKKKKKIRYRENATRFNGDIEKIYIHIYINIWYYLIANKEREAWIKI